MKGLALLATILFMLAEAGVVSSGGTASEYLRLGNDERAPALTAPNSSGVLIWNSGIPIWSTLVSKSQGLGR